MVKVTLDAGHGGKDSGCVGNGLKEKDLTLKMALGVGDILKKHGVVVNYTRVNDIFIELSERANISDRFNSDYFVSFHINAGGGKGFENYIYNGGVTQKTKDFQKVVHDEIMGKIKSWGVIDRGAKTANYAVLRETHAPAILNENLFIDSSDVQILKTKYDELIKINASAILKALGIKEEVTQTAPQTTTTTLHHVQIGSFSDRTNAEKLANELKAKGYPAIIKEG